VNLEDLAQAPVHTIMAALRRLDVSPVELVDTYLERIRRAEGLGAFITVSPRTARLQARAAATRLARRDPAPLLGVPLAVKDLFATAGMRTTAGSRILARWVPSHDAAAVQRLKRAGAIVLGKTNLHEFAYGVTTANPHWGIARNPLDQACIPGGSSGGSGIAVQAGLCAASLGTDTGGSIRIPAALCGCVGFKPSFGRIPLDGVVPLGWSLDHAGPLTRTVADAALLFEVMAGLQLPSRVGQRATIGLVESPLLRDVQPGLRRAVATAAPPLREHGASVRTVKIPEMALSVATQLVTLRAEAFAFHEGWLRRRATAYGLDVRLRLYLGALVGAGDYVLAQRARAQLRRSLEQAFRTIDVLLLPTTPLVAPRIGQRTVRWPGGSEPVDAALVRLTSPFNLTGLPAVSVPFGSVDGLPGAVQVVAAAGQDATALRVAAAIEAVSK
jgi:aspartyl-tRNA(Asn)/glutamyl-tRNA(Gln) amidotransferase subunit A